MQLQSYTYSPILCSRISLGHHSVLLLSCHTTAFRVSSCSVSVPQQELLLLLATGCCTPPLQSFLANTLGEAGLRRLARAVDSMASGLHTALLERLMPLLELVLFLLGELRGCVACGGGEQPPREAWMGLQVCSRCRLWYSSRVCYHTPCPKRGWFVLTARRTCNTCFPCNGIGQYCLCCMCPTSSSKLLMVSRRINSVRLDDCSTCLLRCLSDHTGCIGA